MDPWQKLPLEEMRSAAEFELYAPHHHRPVYSWFRTFGNRGGTLLRFLLLATLSDEDTTASDILEYRDGEWHGDYVEASPLTGSDSLVMDPTMGAGPTVIEGARLGVDTVGYDYNPVLWWVVRQTVHGPADFDETFNSFLEAAADEVGPYFNAPAEETVLAYLLALTVDCPGCGDTLELHTQFELSNNDQGESVYLCPNIDCDDRILRTSADRSELVTCECCQKSFVPEDGNCQSGTFECNCGVQTDLREYFDSRDRIPSYQRYAVFYEDGDGNRRYRELNDTDTTALAEAQSEYRESLGTLPLPISKIQEGKTTDRLLDYGYEQYQQLFTERQRIALGRLLELADEQEPREVAEMIVTLVVATLHYNNIHARWDTRRDSVQTIFRTFNHSIPVETVEANPLVDEWKGSLRSAYDRYVAAKTYLESPSETLRTPAGDRDEIPLPEEALRTERIKQLAVSSVDQLDIETKSVDCAVIDPPYYDAVQHGELHDFHYVWLREVLSDRYSEFSSTHVPKLREIAINEHRRKDQAYYRQALRNGLDEIYRTLRADGDLVCLFHIGQESAWRDIATILVQTGFQIRGAIPLMDVENPGGETKIDYDVAIFARKTSSAETISFQTLRQNLLYSIQEMAAEEREYHPDISQLELRTILRARSLAEYSAHHPNVTNDDGAADVDAAIDVVNEVIRKTL